ncbi:hypothetical protein [Amycolatopsis sp. NPDC004169]|uniref:hypothetical protein n=1 Tax=Amycolatopsis sp. NPDC004169 TaxID=3154453 RepID=UPI0033BB753C
MLALAFPCLTLIILVWLSYRYDRPILVKIGKFTVKAPRRSDSALNTSLESERGERH